MVADSSWIGSLAGQELAAIAVGDTIMEVRLADGSTLFGRVVEAEGERIVVVTAVTLSGGTPVVPDLIGQVFYLAPKLRVVSAPPVEVSAGVLALFATEEIDEGPVGILYGVGTFGSPDRALTLGAG